MEYTHLWHVALQSLQFLMPAPVLLMVGRWRGSYQRACVTGPPQAAHADPTRTRAVTGIWDSDLCGVRTEADHAGADHSKLGDVAWARFKLPHSHGPSLVHAPHLQSRWLDVAALVGRCTISDSSDTGNLADIGPRHVRIADPVRTVSVRS